MTVIDHVINFWAVGMLLYGTMVLPLEKKPILNITHGVICDGE
jgi:hypothetical protein